jgi:hypothetical protein
LALFQLVFTQLTYLTKVLSIELVMAFPTSSGIFNNSGGLGSDTAVLQLDDYANAQSLNYLTTPWKQAVSQAANELAMTETQVIRGTGGHGGDVDVWSMLTVDRTQGRHGDKRVHQPRMFATTPAMKWGATGQYNPDAASALMSAPHTRISRAGGDITEVLPQEIGLTNAADHARLAGLGNAIDAYGTRTGQSTRGSY